MTAAALLERLDAVREVGHSRWRARCPAHDGKNRGVLSIAESSDGTVLVKCFAGCSATDVVRAVGLELHDLFPPRDPTVHAHVARRVGKHDVDAPAKRSYRRPRVDWPALVAACERDLLLVKIILEYVGRRETVTDADARACRAAATRVYALIQEARNG